MKNMPAKPKPLPKNHSDIVHKTEKARKKIIKLTGEMPNYIENEVDDIIQEVIEEAYCKGYSCRILIETYGVDAMKEGK